MQYAGELALNKVLQSGAPSVLSGVLAYANAANNHTLEIDFSDARWKAAGMAADASGAVTIAARDALADKVLGDPAANTVARYDMTQLWGSHADSVVNRAVFALDDAGATIFAANPNADSTHAQLLLGGSGNGALTGSAGNDIIVAGGAANDNSCLKGNLRASAAA